MCVQSSKPVVANTIKPLAKVVVLSITRRFIRSFMLVPVARYLIHAPFRLGTLHSRRLKRSRSQFVWEGTPAPY